MPKISLDWLAEYVDTPADLTAAQLAADLVRVGLEEEEIHGGDITGPVVVGRVVSCTPEEQKNGKIINWCLVDVGEHNVLSDDDGGAFQPRGIVCGAHNFEAGDHVVVALPGAVLPGPFAIASRKTYGHISDGMICSAKELGLGEDGAGIIVLAELGVEAEPGTDALELLGLNRQVLEINVTPDRGYCFSMRGVAREYSHATGAQFRDPASLKVPTAPGSGFEVQVADEAPIHGQVGCNRFATQVVRGVNAAAPAPAWMQRRLTESGMRPINLAVDVTNYVMLELGQPIHAYDLAKVAEPIVVRRAQNAERLTTLDDVERKLHPEDLLITDSPQGAGSRVLGLAGVMGGDWSEVSESTTDVLIEAAHFDPVTVARTARRHKLPSEAAKRFERGVDPALPEIAAQRVAELLVAHGGGQIESTRSVVGEVPAARIIKLAAGLPARVTGIEYNTERVVEILTQIGGEVSVLADGSGFDVAVPSWRPDLQVGEDLVEELARIDGYDNIPSALPVPPAGRGLTLSQSLRRRALAHLAASGWTEVLSYPFIGEAHFTKLGYDAADERRKAVRLANPMDGELPLMRTSVLAPLLDTARRNVSRGHGDFAIFEQGLITLASGPGVAPALPGAVRPSAQQLAQLAQAVPNQPRQLAGVAVGRIDLPGWWGQGRQAGYEDVIAAVLNLAEALGTRLTVSQHEGAPWHPGRAAQFGLADGTVIGHGGELHPKVVQAVGLPARSVGFEVNLDELLGAVPSEPRQARALSTYPLAKEDFAFVVSQEVAAQQVAEVITAAANSTPVGEVLEELSLFDIYTGEPIAQGRKSLAFGLRLRGDDKTLSAEDILAVRQNIIAAVSEQLAGELRA